MDRRERRTVDANRFRKIRLALGYTQEAIARLLYVTPRTVSNWESGLYQPSKAAQSRLHELTAKPAEQAKLITAGILPAPEAPDHA